MFIWEDTEKAKINFQTHGVSLKEAIIVLEYPEVLLIADLEHSTEEDRFILLGLSSSFRLIYAQRIRFFKGSKESLY